MNEFSVQYRCHCGDVEHYRNTDAETAEKALEKVPLSLVCYHQEGTVGVALPFMVEMTK